MKKLLFLCMMILVTSCSTTYHTKKQACTMREFKHAKHGHTGKRGDHYHPAVLKQTRKQF